MTLINYIIRYCKCILLFWRVVLKKRILNNRRVFEDYYILLADYTFKFVCNHIGFVFPHIFKISSQHCTNLCLILWLSPPCSSSSFAKLSMSSWQARFAFLQAVWLLENKMETTVAISPVKARTDGCQAPWALWELTWAFAFVGSLPLPGWTVCLSLCPAPWPSALDPYVIRANQLNIRSQDEMGDVGQPTCICILSLMNFSLTCELSSRRDDWGPWQSLMSFRRKMHTLYNLYYITLITGYTKTDCTRHQECTFCTYGYWLPVFYTADITVYNNLKLI